MSKQHEMLTPAECLVVMPAIKKAGWESFDIGQLLRLGLVKGKKTKNITLIDVNSLVKVVKFKNEVLKSQEIEI